MISVTNLTKRYGANTVLSDVSLTVRKGEVSFIVGPSGGGKSTLLRCLNGLETFDQGQIDVAGFTLTPQLAPAERSRRLLDVRRRVGMVFQQFNLFPHRTVLGNLVEAPLQVLGTSRAAAEQDALELLDRIGLAEKRDAMPGNLSGGQQQRVAIARALAMNPEVLLFDEPTSALDPRMAREVEAVIADLAAAGQTMVVVTHSMDFVRRSAHTVHVFGEGRLLESGPPDHVFVSPSDPRTRAFLEAQQVPTARSSAPA
jgi:ABC-type polar amino acid transport system ATPase subunit